MKRIDTCQVCGAPRWGTQRPALCAEHRKAHDRERKARERRDNPERSMLRNRIEDYLYAAKRQGATDDEAWWCAMAAMPVWEAGQTRPHWLAPFIAAELAWLRDNADVFAKLDAAQWQPVPGESGAVEDEGYQEWEVA